MTLIINFSPFACSFFLGSSIFLRTPFSNTLSLRPALKVTDKVSHPYKTKGKIIVLYSTVLILLDIKREDKNFFFGRMAAGFSAFNLL